MEGSDHAPQSEASGASRASVFDGHQPQDAPHNPNQPGPSSAPDPRALSGDPLDAATKQGMDPSKPNPAQGEPTPPTEPTK